MNYPKTQSPVYHVQYHCTVPSIVKYRQEEKQSVATEQKMGLMIVYPTILKSILQRSLHVVILIQMLSAFLNINMNALVCIGLQYCHLMLFWQVEY